MTGSTEPADVNELLLAGLDPDQWSAWRSLAAANDALTRARLECARAAGVAARALDVPIGDLMAALAWRTEVHRHLGDFADLLGFLDAPTESEP